MKKSRLIVAVIGLIGLSALLAFWQATVSSGQGAMNEALESTRASYVAYSGIKAQVAGAAAFIFNGFMWLTGGSILFSILLLAFVVNLVLLYPNVIIQVEQKKINLIHKQLSKNSDKMKTENDLYRLYRVNNQMQRYGMLVVAVQMTLFFLTFWGLNLIVEAPRLLHGSWNILNFSLLSPSEGFLLPALAAAVYLAHAFIKIYYKEKEYHSGPTQRAAALLVAVAGAILVYFFASIFAMALTLYFVALLIFSATRYCALGCRTDRWSHFAAFELKEALKKIPLKKNRFQYFPRLWSRLPIVRYINFNLLEEALAMVLGLLLALNFFGAFQSEAPTAFISRIPLLSALF